MMASCMLGYLMLSVFMLGLVELKECGKKTLGLRDGDGLPYYYFQGTSYSPKIVNKHINKNTPDGATWCPDKNKIKDSFLEVDLGKQYLLCGVSTQGDKNGFTKSYKIKLSSDRIKWKFYSKNDTDTVFEGNNDAATTVIHPLNSTESARFVRFYPTAYETNACIQVELYGHEIVKKTCEKTAIHANAPDVVVTSLPKIPPNKTLTILNGTEMWCWSSNSAEPYLKVDFGSYSIICALQISFNGMVEISYEHKSLNKYQKINGSQLFVPEKKILTKFLQLKPIGNSSCISVRIFGYLKEELVNEDIGLQYGKSAIFSDESFATSSDQFDNDNEKINPRNGRLYKPPDTFWCPSTAFRSSYLELILVDKYYIFAVSIQGKPYSGDNFTRDFSISYSDDYANWKQSNTNFKANFNNHIQKHLFGKPIEGRIVRIEFPKGKRKTIPCLKVEMQGMIVEESSGYCRKPHPLGLSIQLEKIPYESIKVSSELDGYPYTSARLRYKDKCWCAKEKPSQTISVDLRQLASISGVATQGCDPGKVTKYKIRYSYDGRVWSGFPSNTSLMIFPGNSPLRGVNTIFANWLNVSVIARHIRIEIQDSNDDPCLRLEVYGCGNVLPDVPGMPSISNIKSRLAVITWKAAGDYLESQLERYVIRVSYENYTMKINVTSDLEEKYLTYNLRNLTEYTFYTVSIAAGSAIGISNFTEEVTFLTLYGPYLFLKEQNLKIVEVNEKNITISCTGRSYPTPRVIWKKDGKEIQSRENIIDASINSTEASNNSTEVSNNSTEASNNSTEVSNNSTGASNNFIYQISTPSRLDNKSNVSIEVTSTLFLRTNGIIYEDHGNYTCEVLNVNESSIPLSKTVEIQFPPRITKGPSNMTIIEGENVNLTCDAEGPPKPTFSWSNVSARVTIEEIIRNNDKLKLRNVRSAGKYKFIVTCKASNKGGNSTANATIEILVKPRIINLTGNQTALLYHNVTLTCEILSNPPAQIWWTKDGDTSHLSNVQFENDNKTLVIAKAVLGNIGSYSCHASNSLYSTNQRLTLNLKALPNTYIVGGEIRKLRQGQKNSSIVCFGYGYPDPKATWKINNKEIPEDSNSSIGSGIYQRRSTNDVVLQNVTSTLFFNQNGSTFDDFGNYTCEVSIEAAPDTDFATTKVIFYPIVLTHPNNETYLQGKNVSFDCEVDGRPKPLALWLFNNQSVTTNHRKLSNGSILLYSVQNNDLYEGSYTCFAANEAGRSEKSTSYLTVHVPAKILKISKTKVHQLTDNVTLTCNVTGDPRPSISWTKANYSSPLTPPKFQLSNYNQSLTIMNITLQEQGTYICNATNKYASVRRNVTVNVEVSPQAEVNTSSPIHLNSTDEQAIIRCRGRGYPPPVVSWFRDGKRIDTNNSSDVYQNVGTTTPARFLGWISTILYIKPDSTHSQFGNYTCKATKLNDNEYDLKVVEIVLVPKVSITKVPGTSTVLQGTNVTFTCTAVASPKPTITWTRVNGTIVNGIISYEEKSVLMLTNVTNEEEGMYECTAHNRGEPVKKQVSLIVHVKPRILQHLKDDDVRNGTSYKLKCSAYGDPALKYSWTITGTKNIPNAIPINGSKTLHINPVTIENEGVYKCLVTNIEGNASTTANITVFARPTIINSPVDQTRNETDNVTFSCGGNGIPTADIIWMKHGRDEITISAKYDIKNNKGLYNFQTSYLTINDLTYADRGNYSCTLRNRKDEHVEIAVLVVQVRPVARIDPDPLSVNVTNPVTFTCEVYGFPKPQVSWMKNSQEIRNNSHYNTSRFYGSGSSLTWYNNLQIENVERDDTANYSCFLRNAAGTDIDDSSLVVLERPDPLNVSIKNVTSRSVVVEWMANFDGNRDILHYTLTYFINSSESSTAMQERLSSNVTSYNVTSLKPYSTHIFEMTATNEIGVSDISTKSVDTLPDRPTSPQSVNVLVISSRSLSVRWQAPKEENGIILTYVIYYGRVGRGERHSIVAMESERSKNITNLKPYTNYSVAMVANTSVGYGEKSDLKFACTNEAAPSSPRNLTLWARNSTTISVSWLPPKNENGIIIQYAIHVREQGVNSNERLVNVSGGATSTLVNVLKPFTNYTFRIRARTSAGWGNFSENRTEPTDVGPPVKPTVVPITFLPTREEFDPTRMIAITFTKFSNKNGNIKFYRVIVVMVDETVTNIAETFSRNLLSYQEWIRRENKIGFPYIAFVFKGDSFEQHKNFIVGDGEESDHTYRRKKRATLHKNGNLIPGKQYAVALRGYTAETKYATSEYLKVSTQPAEQDAVHTPVDTTVVVVIVVVAAILSALLLTAVWFRIKKNRGDHHDGYHNTVSGMRNLGHPVPLPEFRFYVQSKQFGEEYQDIPKVVDRETSSAITDTNMQKNRYKNIIPYDYTRVRLRRDEGDDDTDYINANIIKGHKLPSNYIASQGPTPHTTNDFWQMVWEQEVSIIVMLTGLEEKGTVKCYQYWPVNTDEQKYGNLTLKLTGETVLADFTTRYFEMKEADTGQIRLVQHLHFTAWPDHGVPKYPGPLLHFHKRYRSGLSGPEPVVVHCSAGVGRTGTFIAVDYILHKLDEERNNDPAIDILHFVREMRGQRMFMVQTEEQYRFIHHAILEAVTFPDTEISSTDIRVRAAILRETLPGSNKTKGKEVFENLEKRILLEACEDGSSNDNQKKNRSKLLPFDYSRVHLNEMENSTDYINASYICGYQYPVNFIATQHPLPHTVSDFWRMVHEQKSAIVLAISSKEEMDEFGSYWPEEGYASYGPINVGFEGKNEKFAASGFIVRNFKLTDTRDSVGRSFAVTHFNFVDWLPHNLPTASSMICLLAEVEKAQRKSQNTLVTVHCSDGGGRTGTFCAIVSCIERVKLENNIDLPMTLRNLHAQRKDMIQNEAQYIFCYDVISAFLASFDDQMYDNFKPSKVDEEEENYPETTMDGQNRLVSKF